MNKNIIKVKKSINTIHNKYRNYNAFYGKYFSLLKKFKVQYNMVKPSLKFHQKLWMFISIISQVIFKPLLYFFHTFIEYKAELHYMNDSLQSVKNYSKRTTIYFLRIIPIMYTVNTEATLKDIEKIK